MIIKYFNKGDDIMKMTLDDLPDLIPISMFQEYVGMKNRNSAIKEAKKLPYVWVGNRIMVLKSGIVDWFEKAKKAS
jgi:hypothetical protein